MDAAYLKAAHPEPFRILGKDLKPFCMGHELLLQRFKNRFSIESEDQPDESDLIIAVYICSHQYEPGFSLDNFRIWPRAWVYGKTLGQRFMLSAMLRFHQYIEAHTEIPEYYIQGDPEERTVGAPTIQAVKVARLKNSSATELDILNEPFSKVFWDHLTWLEGQGQIQIVDEAEKERQIERATLAASMEATVLALKERLFPKNKEAEPCLA
jgi:hypothetical protein